MRTKWTRHLTLTLCAALALGGCAAQEPPRDEAAPPASRWENIEPLEAFADVRAASWGVYGDAEAEPLWIPAGSFDAGDIPTFTFNEGTILEGSESVQAAVLEAGKNPGLGVRALHAQGIDGTGVRVAIIDQNLFDNHPEYAGNLAALYRSEALEDQAERGTMHGPAVASLLVGESIGVAPGATLYYAAVPGGSGDAGEYARALRWILEQNESLPEGEKIRVVSVSAAPSGEASPFESGQELYEEAVAEALAAGVLVLDTREDPVSGIFLPAFFDPENREAVDGLRPGFARRPFDAAYVVDYPAIGVPCDYRTVAEQYRAGTTGYAYTGDGGLSWGIPYGSGLLALGWQIAPELGWEELVALLMETARLDEHGNRFVHPEAFVRAVQQRAADAAGGMRTRLPPRPERFAPRMIQPTKQRPEHCRSGRCLL